MKKLVAGATALALLGLAAGCSGSGSAATAKVVDLTAQGMTYGTKEITVEKGKPVKLVFHNNDSVLHDFSVDSIAAKVQSSHMDNHDMGGKMPDLHVSVDAGKTGELVFTPNQTGKFTFYCTVAGHKEAGMVGTLIVQ